MLCDVGNRDDQGRARHVGAPRVVHLHMRGIGRDIEPPVGELHDPRPVGVEPACEIAAPVARRPDRRHVPGRQEVDAAVVGEEELRRVEAGGRWEGPPAGGARVVRDPRQVGAVVGDQVLPACAARDGGEQDGLFELGERARAPPPRRRRAARPEWSRPWRSAGSGGRAALRSAERLRPRPGRAADPGCGRRAAPMSLRRVASSMAVLRHGPARQEGIGRAQDPCHG
jgi:hypothetical protein